jgi:hypothetical protein
MAAEDEPVVCEICKKGHVVKRAEKLAFRQWSDKGYVHCQVRVFMGTCNKCGAKIARSGIGEDLGRSFSTGIRQAALASSRYHLLVG